MGIRREQERRKNEGIVDGKENGWEREIDDGEYRKKVGSSKKCKGEGGRRKRGRKKLKKSMEQGEGKMG